MLNSNGNGTITNIDQISFASYLSGAQTDLQGLAAFDTNHDGTLDAGDTDFALFGVLLANGQFESLTQLGITSISLTSNNQPQTMNGNTIFGLTTYEMANGQTLKAADAALSVGIAKASQIHTHAVIPSQHNIDFSSLSHPSQHHLPAMLNTTPHSWSPSQEAGVAFISHSHSIDDHLQAIHHIMHTHG